MRLSIAIVNWNTQNDLQRCLSSIYRHPPKAEFETIVVDNASPDGSAEMVRERFPQALLVANDRNAGYAEGNNRAMRMASGDYVLLLNPDTEVGPTTLDTLVAFGERHPDMAAVGCRLVGTDGRVQSSCRSFPDPRGVLFEYLRLSRLFPSSRLFGSYRMTYFDYAHEAEVDQPMASCLLLSRASIEDIGLIDEAFPVFFNDVDWCYRAKQKGWKIYFTPDAEIQHLGGASTKQVRPAMIRESHASFKRFYEKHYKSRISAPLYWFIMTMVSLNSLVTVRLRSGGG